MALVKTSDFEKVYKKLQPRIQRLFLIQEKRFAINPRDSRLHIKKLTDFDGAFSFRITRHYRALFYFKNKETTIFFDIDHRKDVYR
jgi:mRNA-degrading endonuclease RelE of RelBE toxin-antitoxin system